MMVPLLLGIFIGLVLDRIWWELGFNKYEKGLEIFEHYHHGLMSWILAYFTPIVFSYFLWGLGLALVLAEWGQTGEWGNGVWRRGHPFAYGSKHFPWSTAIGVVLLAVVIALATI